MTSATGERIAELWLRIDQLHLNYMKSEENTGKIEIRRKLEGCVHQYLCLVPQDRKFCNVLTSEILWQSARWLPEFSPLKAASAFEAIEKYAANLINQPWRKEFREIKQYGGFYKHHVESCLSGAEKMFQQMGYVPTGQETLVLTQPVNHDRATAVARDCVLAYVECQITFAILQGVSSQFPCTWEEVMEFRRDHVGSPEQATRALVCSKNQIRFQMQRQQQAVRGDYRLNGGFLSPGFPQSVEVASPSSALPDHRTLRVASSQQQRHCNGVGVKSPQQRLNDAGLGMTSPQGQRDVTSSLGQRSPQGPWGGPIPLTIKQLEEEKRRKSQVEASTDPLGSWDYVYKELENIDKDPPRDALELLLNRARSKPSKTPQNSNGERRSPTKERSTRHSRPLGPPALPQKKRQQQQQQQQLLTPEDVAGSERAKWECAACTFINDDCDVICEVCSKSRDRPRSATPRSASKSGTGSSRFSAKVSAASDDFRDAFGELSDDDRFDGVECPKCTLVNEARLRVCEACGASLHLAPIDAAVQRTKKKVRAAN